MDDRLYRDALRRKAELQRELDELETFIRLAERLLHERDKKPEREAQNSSDAHDANSQSSEPRARKRNSTPPRRLAELAREEILELGRPMTRGELVDALEKRGVEIIAKDKAKNLGTILWRFDDMFVNMPGVGYWPKDVPPPGKMV